MGYATLMVHLQLGCSNVALLQIAGDLAVRFGARVIGIAAAQPIQVIYADACYVSGALVQQDRDQIEADIEAAAAEFRSTLQGQAKSTEWRSAVSNEPVADYIARQARAADLVVTGVVPEAALDAARKLRIGDLIMQVGRPVLIVPTTAERLSLQRVVIGWKDTMEARRATADALPLLQQAAHVTVFEVAAEAALAAARTRCDDVAAWLVRHGVAADVQVSAGDEKTSIRALVLDADILVGGAYGHSRLREWVLGGVTRDLLLSGQRCALVAR